MELTLSNLIVLTFPLCLFFIFYLWSRLAAVKSRVKDLTEERLMELNAVQPKKKPEKMIALVPLDAADIKNRELMFELEKLLMSSYHSQLIKKLVVLRKENGSKILYHSFLSDATPLLAQYNAKLSALLDKYQGVNANENIN